MTPVNVLLFLALTLGAALSAPWEPEKRDEDWWLERHQELLNTTASHAKDIKVVFLGSSTMQYWGTTAKDLWDSKYAPLGAANYGIRRDRTEHVLWRIANGELDGLNPKLVVIYIGSNNVPANTADAIVRGIDAVIEALHEKLPKTNLLFVGFFPRGDNNVVNRLIKIRNVTETLEPMLEGNKRNAYLLDFFFELGPETLDGIYEQYFMEDKHHLNREGYGKWDEQMNTTFYSLIQ